MSENINGSHAEYYLGAIMQIVMLYKYRSYINSAMNTIGATPLQTGSTAYWSSTQYSSTDALYMNFQTGFMNNNFGKALSNVVRPLAK